MDLTPVLRRIEHYVRQVRSLEPRVGNFLYPLTQGRSGGREEAFAAYWQLLSQMRAVIVENLHDATAAQLIERLYKKGQRELDELASQDEDSGHVIRRYGLDTNLYLLWEMTRDVAAGRGPEPS